MKNFLIFIAGMITMLFILLFISALTETNSYPGLDIFEEKGDCITRKNLKIFQTLEPNIALAEFGEFPNEIMVLLMNNEGKTYYDKQKIIIPKNKCARQIGSYQYTTKGGSYKTVPVVNIE